MSKQTFGIVCKSIDGEDQIVYDNNAWWSEYYNRPQKSYHMDCGLSYPKVV